MEREIKCLDHGFVRLVDYMGDDAAIVQAARVSYGKGTKSVNEDKGLINYLIRNKHTSPLEMVEFKFHCRIPVFIARQWIRHRTANVNEMSARYSEMPDCFYLPEEDVIKPQSKTNKQGSEGELDAEKKGQARILLKSTQQVAYSNYEALLKLGVARETARECLPVSKYSQWYWKIDLHNLFHFLKLRLDSHAQYEIRVYAQAMYDLIKPIVPYACEAFETYVLNAKTFSAKELKALSSILQGLNINNLQFFSEEHLQDYDMSKGEMTEFVNKIKELV